MNILYIHQHFCTPKGAGGTRSYEFATRFAAQGHQVTMLCGRGQDSAIPLSPATLDGVRVEPCGVPYDNRMGKAARGRAFLDFALRSSAFAVRAARTDVVLATSTPLTVALPALAAHYAQKRPFVFEVRDVWPDALEEPGMVTNPALLAGARAVELLAYQNARRIVALSTGMRDRISQKGPFGNKTSMLPNCCDLARFKPGLDDGGLRERHNARDRFVILYAGSVSISTHMEYLARAILLTREHPVIQWWIVGAGNRLEAIKSLVAGAPNVVFHGPKPKEDMPRYMAAADAGVVTFRPESIYHENSPNKFFDYIAAGLPVVFNRSSWLGPWLERSGAGFCADPARPESFAALLSRLADNPAFARKTGENARRLAEAEFSRDVMATRYLEILTEVAEGGA
jgi:glycosyltransferase involved in cell wall biosynthesis